MKKDSSVYLTLTIGCILGAIVQDAAGMMDRSVVTIDFGCWVAFMLVATLIELRRSS